MSNINTPIVNAPYKSVNGLEITVLSNTSVALFPGSARDSTNQNDISLPNSTTLNLLINGAGGLDTGTLAASKFYAVHVIDDSTGNFPGLPLASLSANAPLLPRGYDMFRRIGWIVTNGSAQVSLFYQTGHSHNRTYHLSLPILLYTGSPSTRTLVDLSLGIPNFEQTFGNIDGIFQVQYQSAAAGNIVKFNVFNNADQMIALSNGFVGTSIHSLSIPSSIRDGVPTFYVTTTSGSDVVTISSVGFKDTLY